MLKVGKTHFVDGKSYREIQGPDALWRFLQDEIVLGTYVRVMFGAASLLHPPKRVFGRIQALPYDYSDDIPTLWIDAPIRDAPGHTCRATKDVELGEIKEIQAYDFSIPLFMMPKELQAINFSKTVAGRQNPHRWITFRMDSLERLERTVDQMYKPRAIVLALSANAAKRNLNCLARLLNKNIHILIYFPSSSRSIVSIVDELLAKESVPDERLQPPYLQQAIGESDLAQKAANKLSNFSNRISS